MKLTLIQRII